MLSLFIIRLQVNTYIRAVWSLLRNAVPMNSVNLNKSHWNWLELIICGAQSHLMNSFIRLIIYAYPHQKIHTLLICNIFICLCLCSRARKIRVNSSLPAVQMNCPCRVFFFKLWTRIPRAVIILWIDSN